MAANGVAVAAVSVVHTGATRRQHLVTCTANTNRMVDPNRRDCDSPAFPAGKSRPKPPGASNPAGETTGPTAGRPPGAGCRHSICSGYDQPRERIACASRCDAHGGPSSAGPAPITSSSASLGVRRVADPAVVVPDVEAVQLQHERPSRSRRSYSSPARSPLGRTVARCVAHRA
jgi:hypothetical protein